ncbi:neutral sphingomyelinase-like protein [Euroglyphus maynei]|uniref:Neutral sphingomyelinase-like protein n=1 Tax=Euroglyphus maynei TaxID=6958 RepID=A0A1Y3BDH9_EURMA|nr:neutral sphingomyelinase-like protein [Euroglyphus maynei]
MHAQYDLNEKIIDQYSIHRICQAYELGKFINLMSCNCMNTGSKDLIILAGDMNTSSKELPYKMLSMYFSPDSMVNKRLNKLKIQELFVDHESSDEELTTCGHRDNTFTPQQNLKTGMGKTGKRIDFIFYKLRDSCSPSITDHHHRLLHNHLNNNNNGINTMDLLKNNLETILPSDLVAPSSSSSSSSNVFNNNRIENTPFLMCIPEKINIIAKDITGLSFSDHQPVVAKLNFTWKTIQDIVNESNENDYYDNDDKQIMTEEMNQSTTIIETTNNGSSPSSNDKKCSKLMGKKFRRKECYLALREQQPMFKKIKDSTLIQEIETLLNTYVEKFLPSFHYTLITVFIMIIIFISILLLLKFIISLTFIETILMSLIFIIIATIGLLLKFITHRTEINAIKAILNDIQRKKTFHPDYGLRNNNDDDM